MEYHSTLKFGSGIGTPTLLFVRARKPLSAPEDSVPGEQGVILPIRTTSIVSKSEG